MKRKPWIRGRGRRIQNGRGSIAETALEGMGARSWSPAHQKTMTPSKARRIDPDSPEGRAIAAKYATEGQQD